MSEGLDKNIEAIGKLILLTQKGKIQWNSQDPSFVRGYGADNIINSVFVTEYNNKPLRIYQRKYKDASRALGLLASLTNDGKQPEIRWYSEVILELIDNFGNSVWQFPKENILRDLLETVKYKASGAHDVIESLLKE